MALNEYGEQRLVDLEWENEQLKNAIVKHFLGVDLANKPSERITYIGDGIGVRECQTEKK